MTTVTPPRVIASEQQVLDALQVAGFRALDAWFYPAGDLNRAVVRLRVSDGHYEIWRRRKLRSPWMRVVAARAEDFDLAAFEHWRQAWPLTS